MLHEGPTEALPVVSVRHKSWHYSFYWYT